MSDALNRLIDLRTATQHHTALRLLMAQLPLAEPFDAVSARSVMTRLSNVLHIHLRLEDKHLYPALVGVHEAGIGSTASRYRDEMSGLSENFRTFDRRWPDAAAIEKRPSMFLTEAAAVLAQLRVRMDREDGELYPIAEEFFRGRIEETS